METYFDASMVGCSCPELQGLQLWGELYTFTVTAPGALLAVLSAGCSYTLGASWAAVVAVAGAILTAVKALLWPAALLAWWSGRFLLSHFFLVLLLGVVFVIWQLLFPSQFMIRLVSKLPYLRGVTLDLPPAPDQPHTKYVALTLAGGPCPYSSGVVLDTLREAGARATFFIMGEHVEECNYMGVDCGGTDGQYLIGTELLKRMVLEGHELGNYGW